MTEPGTKRIWRGGSRASRLGSWELEGKWKALRRGWYVGGAGFAEQLAEWLAKAVAGGRRESHAGPARGAHDTVAAENFLRAGAKALGLKTSDLGRLPKGGRKSWPWLGGCAGGRRYRCAGLASGWKCGIIRG